jgi:UDP-N-acetylglucosamine 2-epimerase (non-hydrolysing)
MGALVEHAYADVATHAPEVVVALGDTNTVPAYALAARRAGVPLAHLEAGLRSFNPRSLEEVNRAIAAATASLQLAPTPLAAAFLRHEGQDDARVHVVGNPVTDVLRRLAPPPPRLGERDGVLVTAHRATNVDDPERLARLVAIVERLATAVTPVRFPVHPRTQDRLSSAGLLDRLTRTPGLQLEAPLRYPEMLAAIAVARVVVTDSGGLQEEAAWFGVPVVVLRTSTPRWEGVVTGSTRLVGLDADRALAAATELVTPSEQERSPARTVMVTSGHGWSERCTRRLPPVCSTSRSRSSPVRSRAPSPTHSSTPHDLRSHWTPRLRGLLRSRRHVVPAGRVAGRRLGCRRPPCGR